MKGQSRARKNRGFTLIELITVMFIIAVLASIMIPNMRKAFFRAQLTGCQSNLRNIATAVNQYEVEKKVFPTGLTEITPNYIKTIPTCPSAAKDTYTDGYQVSGTSDQYTLQCKGQNHTLVNLGPDEPWYSPERGLGPN